MTAECQQVHTLRVSGVYPPRLFAGMKLTLSPGWLLPPIGSQVSSTSAYRGREACGSGSKAGAIACMSRHRAAVTTVQPKAASTADTPGSGHTTRTAGPSVAGRSPGAGGRSRRAAGARCRRGRPCNISAGSEAGRGRPDGGVTGQGPLAFGMGRGWDEVHDEGSSLVVEANQCSRGPRSFQDLVPISARLKQCRPSDCPRAGMEVGVPLVLGMLGEAWQLERRLAMSVALGPRQCCVAAPPTWKLPMLALRPIHLASASLW